MQKTCWAFLAIAACCAAPASADVVIGAGGVSFADLVGDGAGDTAVFADGAVNGTLSTNAVTDLGGATTLQSDDATVRLGVGDEEWNVPSGGAVFETWSFSWDVDAVLKGFSYEFVDFTNNGELFALQSTDWVGANGSDISSTNYDFEDATGTFTFESAANTGAVVANIAESFTVSAGTLITMSFDASPSATGNFADFRSFTWDLLAAGGGGGGAGVPEPSSFALMGLIGAGVMYRRRRQAAA